MIEIIKKHKEQEAVAKIIKDSGLGVNFVTFNELLDSLTKLKDLAVSRASKLRTRTYETQNDLLEQEIKKFNFFQKYFTQKEEFKKTTESIDSLHKKEDSLTAERKTLDKLINKLREIIDTVYIEKNKFESKKSFEDFGYTYNTAKTFIESLGLDAVLTPEDLTSFNPNANKETGNFKDYAAVHITSYTPESSIKTSYSATNDKILERFLSYSTTPNPEQTEDYATLGNTTYYIPYQPFRNTVHFCLNSPVDGGFFGASNWEKMKYAIICPLTDLQPQIKGTVPQDTFIEGDYNFTKNTVILCPANEVDVLKKQNPNITFVTYDSNIQPPPRTTATGTEQDVASAHLYAPFVISNILGYKYIKTHPHYGFVDKVETAKYQKLAEGAGYEYAWHSNTKSHKDEENKWKIYKNAVILSIIEKEGLSFDEIQDSFISCYFSNIDESLIEDTLGFLIPEIGKEKFDQLVARIKALHKETSKLSDSFSYQKDYSKIKSIVDEISQPENTQPNF